MESSNPDLPLAEPGISPSPPGRRVRLPPAALAGVAGILLMLGAIGGMYIQGPLVRAFFATTGLEPGGGALRAPIAVPAPPPEEGPLRASGVVALGRLQPVGGVIEVAGPTTASAPRVLDLLVQEGDIVEFDAPLVVLDTYPQLRAARDAAERAVLVSETTLEQVRRDVSVGQREGIANVDTARTAVVQANREMARYEQLSKANTVSRAQLESAQAAAEQAAAELRRAEAAAGRLGSTDIKLAEQNLEAARSELARAEVELRTATVYAPSSGTVLSVNVRPGERAAAGTLLSLADLSGMEAEIEVYQDAVPRLSVGQTVRLESPVLTVPLTGTIRRIGLEVGRQSLTSSEPAANTDARVAKAWVDIDAASKAQAARYVGLEVIAHIEVETVP